MNPVAWKPVVGYEGLYEVSSCGMVRRSGGGPGAVAGRTLKPAVVKGGYHRVVLYRNNEIERLMVHRLVAIAFIGIDTSRPCVNHIDSNPSNNRVENLEWCTPKENTQHAAAKGRMAFGERHHKAKLTEADVKAIREDRGRGVFIRTLASRYGMGKSTIESICRGTAWRRVGRNTGVAA